MTTARRGRTARRAGALAAVLTAAAAAAACGGGGSAGGGGGAPAPPSAYLGTVVDRPVPAGIADLPLITDAGLPTSLGAWHGQVVVLADFLTLCQETCPLTTGNLLLMDRAVTAAGLGHRVRFAELTVDPNRDTPSRLRAYRALIGAPANMIAAHRRPAVIERIWRYFGVWYQRVAEGSPPGTDWLTGRALTYDVNHEDALLYLDASGRVRFVVVGSPNASGAPDRSRLAPLPQRPGPRRPQPPRREHLDRGRGAQPHCLADRPVGPIQASIGATGRPQARVTEPAWAKYKVMAKRRAAAARRSPARHRSGSAAAGGDPAAGPPRDQQRPVVQPLVHHGRRRVSAPQPGRSGSSPTLTRWW